MVKDNEVLTPLFFVKRNLTNNKKMWMIVIFSIALCVFVQGIFLGMDSGIRTEKEENPNSYEHTVYLIDAIGGWTQIILAVTIIMVSLSIAVSVLSTVLDRRRTLTILRALGISKKQVFTILSIEYIFIGSVSYLIGIIASIVIGEIWSYNYSTNGVIGIFSTPFSITPLIFFPLLMIFISIITSALIATLLLWNKPLMEGFVFE